MFSTLPLNKASEPGIRRSTEIKPNRKEDAYNSFDKIIASKSDTLFNSIRHNSHHVLRHLLPPPSQASQHDSLRARRHYLQLSMSQSSLTDRNFLHRMLHTDTYNVTTTSTSNVTSVFQVYLNILVSHLLIYRLHVQICCNNFTSASMLILSFS